MALPWTFANATTLFTVRLDDNNNALGALTVIPCTATGTNTIALTPNANTPTISAYTTMSPVFAFIAAASCSGAVTINVNGLGPKNAYKNNGATAIGSGDIVINGLYLCSYNPALNGAVGGFVIDNPSTSAFANTTTTRLITGGPLTYTPPAGAVRFRVRMVGGGGGGGASATNTGSNGTASSFQVNATGTAWTADFGRGGPPAQGAGGAGGTGGVDGSTGTLVVRFGGAFGNAGGGSLVPAGFGGSSVFGGTGGVFAGTGTPPVPKANTGSGGGGGANSGSAGGSGGGAGEYVEFWVTGMTTATYTVGAGGAGGTAGTVAGAAGAAGIIIIEEFYN